MCDSNGARKIRAGEFFKVNTGATVYRATKDESVRGWVHAYSVHYDRSSKHRFNSNHDALTVITEEEAKAN